MKSRLYIYVTNILVDATRPAMMSMLIATVAVEEIAVQVGEPSSLQRVATSATGTLPGGGA
jgi:hypothetical protein